MSDEGLNTRKVLSLLLNNLHDFLDLSKTEDANNYMKRAFELFLSIFEACFTSLTRC